MARIPKILKNAVSSLRPTIKMVGNSIDFDSIYNHSVPKKINRINKSIPDANDIPQASRFSTILTSEEQAAVDRANAQWQADTQARYAEMDKQIENMYKEDDIVYGSPEQILDPNYVSNFDPVPDVPNTTDTSPNTNIDPVIEPNNTINTNTVENNIDNATKSTGRTNRPRRDGKNVRQQYEQRKKTKNKGRSGNKPGKKKPSKSIEQLNKEAQQRKWSTETYKKWQQEETINKINSTRQMYEDVLTDWQSSSGNFSRSVDNYKLTNTHKMYSEAGEYLDYVEDLKVNYNMDDYVDGSYTMEKEVFKYSKGTGLNGEDVLKIEGGLIDAPNAYASDLNKTLKEAAEEMSPEEFAKFKNGFDVDSALVQTDAGGVKLNRQRVVRNAPDMLSKFGTVDMVMSGVNLLGAVGDYKDARRKGHGVVSSAVRAGAQFAIGEALGLWAIPVMAAKELPGLVVKGADALYKENRKMNSMANFQAFGGAQFQDTQQLATMRQSGMEMAKMAQYNLQQTLMGNEATYLHR